MPASRFRSGIVSLSLLIYLTSLTGLLQGQHAAHQQSTAKPPSLQANRQLLHDLDNYIEHNQKALDAGAQSLQTDLALKFGEESSPVTQLKDAFKVLGASYGGYKTGKAYESTEYLDALHELVVLVAGLFGGPIAWSAEGEDLLQQLAETWLLSRYQSDVLQERWNLAHAIQYAQFKDPKNQAEFKRIQDSLNSNLPAERDALRKAVAQTGKTQEDFVHDLFKYTGSSDPFKTIATARGITIVDPDHGIDDLASIPQINPDFITALRRCAQVDARAFSYRGWYQDAMTCDKSADGSYISAFGGPTGRKLAPVSTLSSGTSEPRPAQSVKSTAAAGNKPSDACAQLRQRWTDAGQIYQSCSNILTPCYNSCLSHINDSEAACMAACGNCDKEMMETVRTETEWSNCEMNRHQ